MGFLELAALFEEETVVLIRTDFSSEDTWSRVVEGAIAPRDSGDFSDGGGGCAPNIQPVDDRDHEGLTLPALLEACRDGSRSRGYVLLADGRSMAEAARGLDPTLCYVDLLSDQDVPDEFGDVYGRSFRCVLSEVAAIEANLSISNMEFAEFADHADQHGGVWSGS